MFEVTVQLRYTQHEPATIWTKVYRVRTRPRTRQAVVDLVHRKVGLHIGPVVQSWRTVEIKSAKSKPALKEKQ